MTIFGQCINALNYNLCYCSLKIFIDNVFPILSDGLSILITHFVCQLLML